MFNEATSSLLWFLLLALFFTATPLWAQQVSTIGLVARQHEIERNTSRYTLLDLLVFTASVAIAILIFRYRDPETVAIYGPLMAIPLLTPLFICSCAITSCDRLQISSWRQRLLYMAVVFPAMTLSIAVFIVAVPLGLTALSGLNESNAYTRRVSWLMLQIVGTALLAALVAIPTVRYLLRRYYGFVPYGG